MANVNGSKLYVLDCGYTFMDSNFVIALDTYMTEDNPNAPHRWHKCPTYCVLIKHPTAGNILFDLGTRCDNNEYAPKPITDSDVYHGGPENDLKVLLDKCGVKPEEINYVILSHMHYDHIGNYHLVKDTAEFFISREELNYAFASVCISPNAEDHGFYIRSEVTAEFKRVHIIDEDCELFDGISVFLLPGHTPGVMGCLVEGEERNYFLASDSLYCKASYEGCLPGIIYDSLGFRKSLSKIKRIVKENNAEIWYGHDGEQFDAMKKAPEYYV